jgi:hypothetical protein
MRQRLSLSTNLLIVLAANKKRRTVTEVKPKVSGIRVDRLLGEVRKTVSAYRPTQAESIFSLPY